MKLLPIFWLIDCWGLTPEQQHFSSIQAINMKWIITWTWNDDEMKKGMWHKDNRVNKFWLPQEEREGVVGSGHLASFGRAQRFLLLSNTIAGFFNVRGTWHLSQHSAPLGTITLEEGQKSCAIPVSTVHVLFENYGENTECTTVLNVDDCSKVFSSK